MMIGFMEAAWLRLNGADETDLAELDKIMPDLNNLLLMAKTHKDQFLRVTKVVVPIAEKVMAFRKANGR